MYDEKHPTGKKVRNYLETEDRTRTGKKSFGKKVGKGMKSAVKSRRQRLAEATREY